MKVTLTTASFTANGETTKAESGISATAKLETDAVRTYGTIENKTITLPTAETAKSYAVAGPKWVIKISSYYMWDAYGSYQYIDNGTWEEGSAWYHTGNETTTPTQSCKDCPSYEDLIKYINAGVYWDDG